MADNDCSKVNGDTNATLHLFERNKFFYGKLMSVRDFELEQSYLNGKRQLLNRLIHGVGLVCGLAVTNPVVKESNLTITLASGVAVDCWGREIVVDKDYNNRQVKGTFDTTKLNYLYLKQKPCLKDRVPNLSNASTCEQECCYSRIKEDFDLVLGPAPAAITGTVKLRSEKSPVAGAVVKALEGDHVRATAIADSAGAYTLFVKEGGSYKIRASADSLKTELKDSVSSGDASVNFELAEAGAGQADYEDVGQAYYESHLDKCPACDCGDPRVLLAALNKNGTVNPTETRKYRSIVYNNPMLYDLISGHLSADNPHDITAETVKALMRINDVGNKEGRGWVPEILLEKKPETAIEIEPKPAESKILIGETHSDDNDNPHDVEHSQLLEVQEVNPNSNNTDRNKHVSNRDALAWYQGIRYVRPSSDGATWGTVRSKPDGSIDILGTAGIKVEQDGNHQITISSTGGGGGAECLTGVVIFKNVPENKAYTAPPVPLPSAKAFGGIILGVEVLTDLGPSVVMGDDLREWGIMLTASEVPASDGFAMSITLRSREPRESLRVRWWAVMPTEVLEDIEVGRTRLIPEEVVVGIIAMNPNITAAGIRETYNMTPTRFNTVIESLMSKNVIRRVPRTSGDNSRFTVIVR